MKRVAVGLAVYCALVSVRPASAQSQGMLQPGEVVERIAVGVDTAQAYALYAPTSYSTERAWPILYVMDPRGRALHALELFRSAAEELGWIVASSYNSRSDVPEDRNTPAFNAMLDDTQRRVSIDTRRLYLAGFSGTAESSWYIAHAMAGSVAGIVVAGYGLPLEVHLRMQYMDGPPSFAVFGTAGRTGFNYELVYDMDAAMDDFGVANRVSYFDGGHEWMPEALASDALRWMELRAVREGLRVPDAELLTVALADVMERADALAGGGWVLEAVSLLDGALADFPESAVGIRGVLAPLADSDAYRAQLERRTRDAQEASEYSDLLQARFGGRSGDGPRVAPDRLASELRIAELLERVDADDRLESLQARRLLASASVLLSFYGPRTALRKGSGGHALDLLAVAEMIQPEHPGLCRFRAFAHAQMGDIGASLESLRCWTDWAVPSAEELEAEPYLAPLSEDPGFRALLASLRVG